MEEKKKTSSIVGIFPNPSRKEITILLPVIEESNWDIELLDLNGKILVSESTDKYKVKMDISKIPNGLYLIHLLNAKDERIVKRIQILK
ncbi:MAG: T9SS type A sorting domain-containing protein [Saprospiraceae bacterium]